MATKAIQAVRTTTDSQPPVRRIEEDESETFLRGAPVMLNAGGFVVVWDGTVTADEVIGIAAEDASNLTTEGVPKHLTFGSVPNQSSAVNIPRGAPLNDGRCGVFLARDNVVFKGQINPSGQSLTQADIGAEYGLTIDSDNNWYVDKTKTGANAMVKIVGLDSDEDNLAAASRRGVYFLFLATNVEELA